MPVCLICVYIYITQLRAPWETTWETCLDIRRWVFNSLVTQELEKSSHMTDIQSNSVHTDATKSVLIKWLHGYGFSCSFMRTVSWDIFSRPWSTRSSSNFIVIKKSPDTRLRIWELARLKYARSSNFQWSQSNLHSNLFFNVFAPSTSNFAEMYNYIYTESAIQVYEQFESMQRKTLTGIGRCTSNFFVIIYIYNYIQSLWCRCIKELKTRTLDVRALEIFTDLQSDEDQVLFNITK